MNLWIARNVVSVVALVLGLTLITSANMARAEALSCDDEFLSMLEAESEGLPVICDRIVVVGQRPERAGDTAFEFDLYEFWSVTIFRNEAGEWVRSQSDDHIGVHDITS